MVPQINANAGEWYGVSKRAQFLLLPPITKDSAKLDLGATEGRYDGNLDGNLSTCDYPRVNWTRSLDCDGQNGTVSSS